MTLFECIKADLIGIIRPEPDCGAQAIDLLMICQIF